MTRRHLALLALACLAFVMPAIACRRPVPIPPIPTTTLSSAVPPFTEADITASSVQVRAGATGRLLWQRSFPQVEYVAGLVENGTIYRSTSGIPLVAALRADDGDLLWQFGQCANSDDSISILGDILYATCSNEPVPGTPVTGTPIIGSAITSDTLYALDARTGQVRWSAHAAHLRAVLAPGLVIAQTPVGLEGLRVDSGAVLWTHKTTITAGMGGSYTTPFVVMAGHGLIAYSPDGLTVAALRASDGSLLWSTGVGTTQEHSDWTVLAITSSVVVVHSDYGLVALDSASGSVRWQRRQPYSSIQLSVEVSAEQVVYAGSHSANETGQELGAYSVSDGSPLWPKSVHINDLTSLWLCSTTLYAVGYTEVRALRAMDGRDLWDDIIDSAIFSTAFAMPVVGITTESFVYLLNAPDGKLVWKVPRTLYQAGESLQVFFISQTGQPLGCSQTS